MDKRTPTPPNAGNPEPTTPPRVPDVSAGGKLLSTPSNRGSASISEHLTGVRVDDVYPKILVDIQDHATCTVDALLKALLSLCSSKDIPPANLLNQCVNAVLPICNAKDHPIRSRAKSKRGDEKPSTDGLELRKYLKEYCQSDCKEVEGYQSFIYAFNHALRALHDIEVPLRKSTELTLLFHRTDTKPISATHSGYSSKRKPDIILVYLDAAQKAFEEGDEGSWDDYAFKTAGESPKNAFEWCDCLSSGELRRTKTPFSQPPAKYTAEGAKDIPPQAISKDPFEVPEELTQPSRETMLNLTVQVPLRRSPRQTSQSSALRKAPSSSASSSLKRRSDREEGSSSKKAKTQSPLLKRMPAPLQGALYAAERLSNAIWISHAINLVVIDDVAYVWWFDSEGAIQSHGINFVQDLPYFLVLLLCFQRFTPKDWGIITAFKFAEHDSGPCRLSIPASPSVDVDINHTDKIRGYFGIVGRATQVLLATSKSKYPEDANKSLEGTELVVKVYWPEESRVSEGEIIEKAREIANRNEFVNGHIPDLICSHDFDEFSTKRIRMSLGIESKGHRLFRVMLFRRLYPITDLTGKKFWDAFWQCYDCHHHLWVGGVEHNDISVKNLMYDKFNEDRGILNDYDLAHLEGNPRPSGTERTGTMPFMALDLLTKNAWDGKVERRYRHDCESFAWVLLWICCRYDNGKEIRNAPLSGFITHSYERCFESKFAIVPKLQTITATASYKGSWDAAIRLVNYFFRKRLDRDWKMVLPEGSPHEPELDDVDVVATVVKLRGKHV